PERLALAATKAAQQLLIGAGTQGIQDVHISSVVSTPKKGQWFGPLRLRLGFGKSHANAKRKQSCLPYTNPQPFFFLFFCFFFLAGAFSALVCDFLPKIAS